MPIITKPASIQKNSPAEVSLDKSALAAVASVAASTYYSDSTNWKEVFIYYKSSVGNQREVLKFNATVASPVATFLVSEKARDIFQVQKIVIVDFDNGSITVPRSQLTVADFDVDMTPIPPGVFLSRDFVAQNSIIGEEELSNCSFQPTRGIQANSSGNVYAIFWNANLGPGTYNLSVEYEVDGSWQNFGYARIHATPADNKYAITTNPNTSWSIGGAIANPNWSQGDLGIMNPIGNETSMGIHTYNMTLEVAPGKSIGSIRLEYSGLPTNVYFRKVILSQN